MKKSAYDLWLDERGDRHHKRRAVHHTLAGRQVNTFLRNPLDLSTYRNMDDVYLCTLHALYAEAVDKQTDRPNELHDAKCELNPPRYNDRLSCTGRKRFDATAATGNDHPRIRMLIHVDERTRVLRLRSSLLALY